MESERPVAQCQQVSQICLVKGKIAGTLKQKRQPHKKLSSLQAGDGTRTRDLLITNQLLCQLSYTGKKWALTGSNRRHSACKADALPAELNALMKMTCTGFEPVNASVKGW